jgi:hypothetical protein
MRSTRLSLSILFVISSLASAQEADTMPAYTAEEVAKLTDEQILAIALAEMDNGSLTGELEACVAIDFNSEACGGVADTGDGLFQDSPTCIARTDPWLPPTCTDLFEPLQYTNLTLRDRFGYYRDCLSGDTHEGDTCIDSL